MWLKQINSFHVSIGLIVFLAFGLRLYPGQDHFLWNTSDYPRDLYTVREMVQTKDIRFLGPRAEVYDRQTQSYNVFAGPLYYYFLAPWYGEKNSDPNLAVLAFIILHISGMIPLGLLARELFKEKKWILATLLLYSLAYEQIEYSRWLLNPAMAVPFLSWMFYLMWLVYQRRKHTLWLGLVTGLAIQAEIFLGYWVGGTFLFLMATRQRFKQFGWWMIGLSVGGLPLILADLKFNFRMTKSLVFNFLLSGETKNTHLTESFQNWMRHWGVVAKQTVFGTTPQLAFIGVMLLVATLGWWVIKRRQAEHAFLLFILCMPLIIFVTHFQESIYVDIGVGFVIILIMVTWLKELWRFSPPLVGLTLVLICFGQLRLLGINTNNQTPFTSHFFLKSDTFLYQQRLELAELMYQEANGQPFSISVLETPYGWQAMWASIFEEYSRRHHVALPTWYGFHVQGIPGDSVFALTDQPEWLHVVLRPQSLVIDQVAQESFYQSQNEQTDIVRVIDKYNYRLEFRQRKSIAP